MASCPMHAQELDAGEIAAGVLARDEMLVLPMGKAFVTHWTETAEGARELVLFYRDKEISFDEPHLFAFAETLARQKRFRAGEATGWGEGYDWSAVAPLLEYLIAEGILLRADDAMPDAANGLEIGECPSPLPPAPAVRARDWNDCSAITMELTGQTLDLAHLEMVVPPYRLAHMFLDADGRQVGEANVYPPTLRLDVPTRWAACSYAGSRYQTGKPMNVTALKAMRAHWGPMMAILLRVRDAYLVRFPEARDGWTVGHVERLTSCVLGLANYQLMRRDAPVANGALHPALSSVYRVTDGVRMVTHQMMFIPTGEGSWSPDQPVAVADIHDYAERNFSFHSDHGVCAGPRLMVEEFLRVLIDGEQPTSAPAVIGDAAILDALSVLDFAIDYALLGLQVHAITFSLWPEMGRAYTALSDAIDRLAATGNAAARDQAAIFADQMRRLRTATYFGTEQYRALRNGAYADMFAQSARGLCGALPERSLDEILAVVAAPEDAPLIDALNARLATIFDPRTPVQHALVREIAHEIFAFHKGIRNRIVEGQKVQDRINALLMRTPAKASLSGRQFWIAKELLGSGDDNSLESLVNVLKVAMNIEIDVDAGAMALH